MINKETAKTKLPAGPHSVAVSKTETALNKALETLGTYDWGADRNALNPIDEAIVSAQGNTAALKPLEKSLADALAGGISRSAQDYVCRKLRVVGTAQSVDALAALLSDEETSHIARYALERIPDKKAADALREALSKVSGKLKPGIIGSLGARRDKRSMRAISKHLGDPDIQVAKAAAQSLGLIGTWDASRELKKFADKASADMKIAVADACLACAEQLLADGKKADAVTVYKDLEGDDQPTHVRAAALKGILTAATRK